MSFKSGSVTTSPPVGDESWLGWFLSQEGNEFLCRVPSDYMMDKFNLCGLDTMVTNYTAALNAILDSEYCLNNWVGEGTNVESEWLYGLIHARYIMTPGGIDAMRKKFDYGDFGICPRVYCRGQHVLPIGLSEEYNDSMVKIYCPRCLDIFDPPQASAMLAGCMFGTSFPQMFFMELPSLRPQPPTETYVPRLYGFQVHKSALHPPSEDMDS
ncbi:suppressor-of-stellate-like protein [Drosophila obscura]|uniref:suppressor-of-stellate-like protein n=1 Tax=Drosophila obscura TaxID=7282 RepID=UPI001BB29096|nr:suppressor-of-stellate-like protein [Drosophila obscura]